MNRRRQTDAPAHDSRRRFTKTLAAAFVAAPLAATTGAQTTPPATREATAPPDPRPTPAATQTQQQPPPSPVALAYADVARARFGDKLTPEELTRVRRDLEGNVRTADRLRAAKLRNADEPDFVFFAGES